MKNATLSFLLFFGITVLFSSFLTAQNIKVEQIDVHCNNLPFNQKTILGVSDFKVSARGANRQVGTGMTDMLMNALVETGCFRIVDRNRMNDLMQEQALGMSGAINQSSAAKVGQMTGAQMLVMANITEFKERESGVGLGVVMRKLPIKVGGIGKMDAHLGMIIRITDVNTGEIMLSKSVEKKISKIGAIGGGSLFGISVGGGFFKSKAMQDAVEEAIIETVEIIAQQKNQLPSANTQTVSNRQFTSNRSINKADCQLLANGQSPSFMVIIPEEHISRRVPDPAGETEIIRQFLEFGLNVVDPQQVAAIREQERVQVALTNPVAAAQLGRDFGADFIIVGEAFSEFASRTNGMVSCRARVEAKAIETATGKIIATNGAHAAGLDISELVAGKAALRNAGTEMATYFLGQFCNNSNNTSSGTTAFQTFTSAASSSSATQSLEILLVDASFSEVNSFDKFLKSTKGVQSVNKSYTGGNGRFQVSTSTSTDDLADQILNNFSAYNIEITGFEANKLTLAIQ